MQQILRENPVTRYRDNPQAIRSLLRGGEVHRDVYIDRELYDLEMERVWRRGWVYLAHDSQVPASGDYYTAEIAGEPLLMTRAADGKVHVLYNRCAHRGARLVSAVSGNCGGILRCPYHGWTYKADGTLRTVPMKSGYAESGFDVSGAASGISAVPDVAIHRGFVFVRLSAGGPSFADYFGESLSSIDNMADRSPEGRLEVVGGVLRYMHDCNWKLFIENLNDTMHPMVAHESSAGTARDLWKDQPPDAPKPMVIEQFLPFVSNYEFFDKMGVRIYDDGHSYTGVNFSIHSKYAGLPEYEAAMAGSVWCRAGTGDPHRNPPQHGLLSEPHRQGRHPDHPGREAARASIARSSRAIRCGWSARPSRCSNAA